MALLFDWLRAAAERFPDKDAAVFSGAAAPHDRITFAELDRQSDRVAAFLSARGIGPGDRVAILHDNSLPALVWFWGILKSGAASVDVPGLAGKATMQGVLDEARPKAIAIDARQLAKSMAGEPRSFPPQPSGSDTNRDERGSPPRAGGPLRLPPLVLSTAEASDVAAQAGLELHTLESILAGEDAEHPRPAVGSDDVALVVYTSGTTGRPNGVMLSHGNFVANLTAANELMGLGSDASILVVVPLYYIHGRMQLLLHAMLGGTLVFSAGFQFPQKVLQELAEHRTTGFSGVPYHFKQLLDRSKLAGTPLPDLQYVLITGGALAPAELRRLQEAMPGVGIHLAYGQTEAAPRITWIGPEELFAKEGSVGRALPNVVLEILGGDDEPVAPGQIGEVVAGGPNIMKGYVSGDEVALGKIDAKGRLRTGDLGRVDEHGHLHLVGRSSEMIKSAGERIFPQEVEEVLLAHPAVVEAAVIAVPDKTLGEKMVAYVVTEGAPLEPSDLKAHCLQSLPFVRVPKAFEMVPELPKTGSGKVDRGSLRKAARAAAESGPKR